MRFIFGRKKTPAVPGRLIAGLGNPGNEYAATRHNIGFRCINHLAKKHGISVKQSQCQAQMGTGPIDSNHIILAKPKTYMNLSGKSVKSLMQRYKITPQDLIVIHDDMDIPLGRIRLYSGGGAGGHRGIESIYDHLGTRDLVRVRVGIGRPPEHMDPVAFVLSEFLPGEVEVVERVIRLVGEAVEALLNEDLTAAMNRFNQRREAEIPCDQGRAAPEQ